MKKKRLLGIILSITLILGLTPWVCMTARAADNEYAIWVKDIQVTDVNKNNVLEDANETVKFNSATNTLTLNNADIDYDCATSAAIKIGTVANTLTIELKGDNKVKNTNDAPHYVDASGIYSYSQNIIIKGDGKLETSGHCGIAVENNSDLTIESGTVTATGNYFAGIFAGSGTVTINGGTVTAKGKDQGIKGNVSVEINGGTVNALGNGENSRGIEIGSDSLTIDGGTVHATGKQEGIFTQVGSIRISGGTVTAESNTGSGNGIRTYSGSVNVNGGEVHANGGQIGVYSSGNGNITIGGGVLHATGLSSGIRSSNTAAITITGGKVYTTCTCTNSIGIDADSVIIESGELNATGDNAGICATDSVVINGGCVAASGSTISIRGTLKNAIFGKGWNDAAGSGAGTYIERNPDTGCYYNPTSTSGPKFKKVQFLSAMVTTEPKAKELTYDKTEQELVTRGIADSHGNMKYALGSSTGAAISSYSETIPKAKEVGKYYVWYKAESNTEGYDSSVPKCVVVTINEPVPTPIPPIPVKPYAVVKKAPEVTSLIYNGQPQELVAKGEAVGGTMEYAIGIDATTAPTDGWSKEIPTATDDGTYHIWYRVVGDKKHKDVAPSYVGVTTITGKHSDNVLSIDEEKGTAIVKDDVSGGTAEVPIEVITEGPIYRMYDPNRGEHIYTKKWTDVEVLLEWGWIHESDSDFTVVDATDEDAVPVYRLYNPNFGGMHYYTDNAEDAKYLASVGWNYEGISHYVYKASSTKGTPQHKLYNPNSPSGEHIWLSDESGINMLIDAGWIYEGICWRIA